MRFSVVSGRLAALALMVCFGTAAQAETPLERGAYLVRGIVACGNCHTPQGPNGPLPGKELSGGNPIEFPGMFTANPPNITPDPETGIGKWSDDQIITAIREGRRPDGSVIGPPMPIELYRGISDRDVRAIVAYLRVVPPVVNKVAKSSYQIPLPPSYGPPVTTVPEVSRDDPVAYGAYLAGPLGHCIECHTPHPGGQADFEHQLGAGGFELPGPWGVAVSANITPDPKDGIARYSAADIKRAITRGVRPNGVPLSPPMPFGFYRNIDDADLDAIVAYLRTLKPRPSPK